MTGNRVGGLKTAEINRKKRGRDFYKRIGRIGGQRSNTGGFAYITPDGEPKGRELASEVGRIGGQRSRRGKAKK